MASNTSYADGPTTLKRAKAAYKALKGARKITEQQQRRMDRDAELCKRAERFQDQERREKEMQKKKDVRLRKEQMARKQLGIGLATQLVGYSHTQKRMKSGMEAFLGLKKQGAAPTVDVADVAEEDGDLPMVSIDAVREAETEDLAKDDDILNQFMEEVDAEAEKENAHPSLPEGTSVPQINTTRPQTGDPVSQPSRRTLKRTLSQCQDSMEDDWIGVFASNTQLARELSFGVPPGKRQRVLPSPPPDNSDDLTINPQNNNTSFNTNYGSDITDIVDLEALVSIPSDQQVKVRDFAFPVSHINLLEKEARPSPPRIHKQSSSHQQFGLSTQILTEAFDDSDFSDLNLDEDSEATIFPSHDSGRGKSFGSPWRIGDEPVFKPPLARRSSKSAFSELGLSTQLLYDAVEDDVVLSPVAGRRVMS